jgi:AcrR family transcriptional regulator
MNRPTTSSRRRRAPEEVRLEALAAARAILLDQGPQAITLKAVGDVLGMTHANLIHHFGSAGQLQSALMRSMVDDLKVRLLELTDEIIAGRMTDRALVDAVFDAFEQGGAGRLAAWIALSGGADRLADFRPAVIALADAMAERHVGSQSELTAGFLVTTLMALGDALLGPFVRGVLGLPDDASRALTAQLLPGSTEPSQD